MATTPTSTPSRPARPAAAGGGFTLLELIVVLAIIAVVVGISLPRLAMPFALDASHEATREIASGLAAARAAAIRDDREVAFVVDVEDRYFQVGGGAPHRLPATLHITLYTAQDQLVDAKRGAIRFYPDGSASGGHITVAEGDAADASRSTVRVRWLTGRATIEP